MVSIVVPFWLKRFKFRHGKGDLKKELQGRLQVITAISTQAGALNPKPKPLTPKPQANLRTAISAQLLRRRGLFPLRV